MSITPIPQLLLIAGNGRKSGKTTLACNIIRHISIKYPILAVKISPHLSESIELSKNTNGRLPFIIEEETSMSSSKDSSRMLLAGAYQSLYIRAVDADLVSVISRILTISGNKMFIVCESGGLRHYAEPSLFFIVNEKGRKIIKPQVTLLKTYTHTGITFDGIHFDFDVQRISIKNNQWTISE